MPRDTVNEVQTNASMRASALSVLEAHNIIEPPVNIYQILKDEEIPVDFWGFQSKIEGLYINDVTGVGIAINANRHPVKKRFTAAHELKHHRHDGFRSGLMCNTDVERLSIEQRANRFAAEILMPPDFMRTVSKELDGEGLLTATILTTIFHVSYEAVVYRLNTLGLITDGQKNKLLKPTARKEDSREAYAHRASGNAARLRTTAAIAAFSSSDGFSHCGNCSNLILDSRWRVCHSCGGVLT